MSNQCIEVLVLGVIAAAALTKNRAVTAAGAHAATDVYGIAAADAAGAGAYTQVRVQGTAPVEAGAAIPAGTKYVIADAQGRAIVGGTAAANLGKLCPGQAAGGAGDVVEVLLTCTV
jgi:hypothetical protein